MVTAMEALIDSKVAELSGGKVDVGDFVISAAASKTKFLLCNGGAYSRATYAALFAKIGTAFGAGDGSTTFNVPDPRSRTLLLAGSGPLLTTRAMNDKGGEETHFLTIAEMPSHAHGVNDPGHTHSVNAGSNTGSSPGGGAQITGSTAAVIGNSATGVTIQNNGGGAAHNNMPPFLTIGNLFIYAGV